MAGRPATPIDFIGADQIEILVEKMRALYALYLGEVSPKYWMTLTPDKAFSMKRSAKATLDLLKGTLPMIEQLCKQYDGNEGAMEEMKQMMADIKLHEGKVSGK